MNKFFRRAALHYPLNTSNADWDKISNALKKRRNKNSKFLWLLLLLPLTLICTRIVNPGNNYNNLVKEVQDSKHKKVNKTAKSHRRKAVNTTQSATTSNNWNKNIYEQKIYSISSISHGKGKQIFTPKVIIEKVKPFIADINTDKENFVLNKEFQKENNTSFIPDSLVNTSIGADNNTSTDNLKDESVLKDENKGEMQNERMSKFSVGVAAGPDFSTVNLQKIKNIGYTFELITAYRFTKHWSVESGVNFVKKNYYSTGKYFNKEASTISTDEKIISINGSCTMYEVPLNIKYDFDQHKKGGFFAVAGISSYLMKKESYNYIADHLGNIHKEDMYYKNPGNNLFSILNISGGYELKLNRANQLRIEPYLKVPLGGMGIGSMPVMRTGVKLGITRTLR